MGSLVIGQPPALSFSKAWLSFWVHPAIFGRKSSGPAHTQQKEITRETWILDHWGPSYRLPAHWARFWAQVVWKEHPFMENNRVWSPLGWERLGMPWRLGILRIRICLTNSGVYSLWDTVASISCSVVFRLSIVFYWSVGHPSPFTILNLSISMIMDSGVSVRGREEWREQGRIWAHFKYTCIYATIL